MNLHIFHKLIHTDFYKVLKIKRNKSEEVLMPNTCSPENIRLKSNFLGPKSENGEWLEKNIVDIFSGWCEYRRKRFPSDGPSISESDLSLDEFKAFQSNIFDLQKKLSTRFEGEVPKYSPRYMGHMISEISLPALFGHIIGLIHNPNNSNIISSKVGLKIETEAIEELNKMIGYGTSGMGHFTSGGTVANIEGAWRARYRLDNAIALGALKNISGDTKFSIFEAAHMAPELIQKYFKDVNLDTEKAKKYSFVYSGPYLTQSLYEKTYHCQFKGPILLVPAHKHYSWQKATSLLGLGEEALWTVSLDKTGHLCVEDLKRNIEKAKQENRPILCVVSVAGTTELGMVDPIEKVQDLLDDYKKNGIHIWHHVDGAYGGIYTCLLHGDKKLDHTLSDSVLCSLSALKRVETITLDPHKLAMVPYACGAILAKNEECYFISKFDAPYLSNKAGESTGKWDSTLEGSRAATGACATWMVAKSLGLNKAGLGSVLSLGLKAKSILEEKLKTKNKSFRVFPIADSNIVCFSIATQGELISTSNKRTQLIYDKICNEDYFSISKTTLVNGVYGDLIIPWANMWEAKLDTEQLVLIRMVIMNPFSTSKENNFDYLEEFIRYLSECSEEISNELLSQE